jgi:hypothetical protein
MKHLFSGQIFEKYSNINYHESESGGIWVVSCGRLDTQMDG